MATKKMANKTKKLLNDTKKHIIKIEKKTIEPSESEEEDPFVIKNMIKPIDTISKTPTSITQYILSHNSRLVLSTDTSSIPISPYSKKLQEVLRDLEDDDQDCYQNTYEELLYNGELSEVDEDDMEICKQQEDRNIKRVVKRMEDNIRNGCGLACSNREEAERHEDRKEAMNGKKFNINVNMNGNKVNLRGSGFKLNN